jgi:hypothetical protein
VTAPDDAAHNHRHARIVPPADMSAIMSTSGVNSGHVVYAPLNTLRAAHDAGSKSLEMRPAIELRLPRRHSVFSSVICQLSDVHAVISHDDQLAIRLGGVGVNRLSCSAGTLERVKGIEPSYAAWEAAVLPLNYTRVRRVIA